MVPSTSLTRLLCGVLSLAVAVPIVTGQGAGLTLSLCTADSQCKEPRKCFDATTTTQFSPCSATPTSPSLCVCAPRVAQGCAPGGSECAADGEVCARTVDSPSYCADPMMVESNPDLFPANEPPPAVSPTPVSAGAPPPPVWRPIGKKTAGEQCASPLECGDGVFCLAFNGTAAGTAKCASGDTCRCVPGTTIKCAAQVDCSNGAQCVGVDGGATVCLAPEVAGSAPDLRPAAEISPMPMPSPMPSTASRETPPPTTPTTTAPSPSASASGPASPVAPTKTPSASAGPSQSTTPAPTTTETEPDESVTPSVPRETPEPAPVPPATNTTGTVSPSTSTSAAAAPSPAGPTPVSALPSLEPSAEPSEVPEEEDEGPVATPVCVAVHHLAHLDAKQLVFDAHFKANVLCDAQMSCATSTHIVVHNGRAMSMRAYCKKVTCVAKTMLVNSPKYQRALRVKSRTHGLEFTTFAARFGTRVEEAFLSAAVHLRL